MRITPFPSAYAKAYTSQTGGPKPVEPDDQTSSKPAVSFGEELKAKIEEVNNLQHEADDTMKLGAVQGAQNIHDSMIKLEQADMSFRLLVKTRNKALEAYQEVMRMQF